LKIIVQRAADVIMVDPFQAGGLWQAKKICALAEAAGLPVSLHTSADTSLGLAAHLQLAASTPNLIYATDTLFPINADDLARQPLVVSSGRCAVPDGPGLGVELDAEALQRAVSRPPIRREWVRMWL
jgi:glucarate dehydratase